MVILPLNAFDRKEVLEKGQAVYIKKAAEAEADGVEIRRELLTSHDSLNNMKEMASACSLFTVFSAPVSIWSEDGTLQVDDLKTVFDEAAALGAAWVKLSLGHYRHEMSDLKALNRMLSIRGNVQVLVENDQTPQGGTIEQLVLFFGSALKAGVPVQMTFDIGNWHFTGEHPEEAYNRLQPFISYLHLKEVTGTGNHLFPKELSASEHASWRHFQKGLGKHVPAALEFPIEPEERAREFVRLVRENQLKGEKV